MACLYIVLAISAALSIVYSEDGCSDYDCECHPDQNCNPPFARKNLCHEFPRNCFGPIIQTVFTINFTTAVVQSMIPDDLEPEPNPTGLHPVLFEFAQQHNVGPSKWNYMETIIGVSVRWNDANAAKYKYRGPFQYGIKLWLDNSAATASGQSYGINKQVTNITQSCDNNGKCTYIVYEPHTRSGEKLLEANWEPASSDIHDNGSYVNASTVHNFWKHYVPKFNAPCIGEFPVNKGVYQCLWANWFPQYGLLQPQKGNFTIYKSFIGNMPTGTWRYPLSIYQAPVGPFRWEGMWQIEDDPSPTKETCTNFVPVNNTVH